MESNTTKNSIHNAKNLPLLAAVVSSAIFILINAATLGEKSLWVDELRTAYAALCNTPHELFRYIALNDPASPLYTLISVLFCRIFGVSEIALRFPALLFGAASIFMFAAVAARILKNQKTASLAVVLFALAPNLSAFSQEARSYTAFLCLSLVSILLITREDKSINLPALAVSFIAGIYIHLFFILVIFCCILHVFLINKEKRARFTVLTCVVVAVVALAPYLLAFSRMNTGAPELMPGPQLNFFVKIAFIFTGLIAGNSYVDMGVASMIGITGTFVWLYGFQSLRYGDKAQFRLVALWTFAPVAAIVISFTLFSKYYEMFHFRYVIFVLPFMAIAIAAGVARYIQECIAPAVSGGMPAFKKLWLRPLGVPQCVYVLLILFFAGGMWTNVREYYRSQTQDWRAAYKYIEKNAGAGDLVVMQGIADSSIRFYARGGAKKLDMRGTNKVSETAALFGASKSKFFVYYLPKWGVKFMEKSRRQLDGLVNELEVFPGLYGDVVVGRSAGCTLVDELAIYASGGKGFSEKLPDIPGGYIAVRGDDIRREACGGIYNVADGEFALYAEVAKNVEEGGLVMRLVKGSGSHEFAGSIAQFVKLGRGNYDLVITHPLKLLVIKRTAPLKFVDEGGGREMRGWFLDWIRK